MRDVLSELGFGADPVPIDDEQLLFLSPACDDWAPIVERHGLSAVIDLEGGLDSGIPVNPDKVIYVYFPFKDEDVPTLHKLHAVARLGAALVAGLVLVYSGLSGEDAVTRLQARRPGALYNEIFAAYLRALPAGGPINPAAMPSVD